MINKMAYRDCFLLGKIKDKEMKKRYLDPDSVLADGIDPETKRPIERFPPKLKAQLVMNKKNRNEMDTDVMDENDVQRIRATSKKGTKSAW